MTPVGGFFLREHLLREEFKDERVDLVTQDQLEDVEAPWVSDYY